ncbi:hypothetical protein [Streptomyces sp. NPDC001312]|uniref:hypothetical protein n=1 Tax=Streptomyces sp. NPDC001312 TaxID=3364561 RepID=UPI0036A79EB2
MARAAVCSGGSWGTAVAKILGDAGGDVIVHARRPEIVDAISARHRNPVYWPDVELPPSVAATTDPAAAGSGTWRRRYRSLPPPLLYRHAPRRP